MRRFADFFYWLITTLFIFALALLLPLVYLIEFFMRRRLVSKVVIAFVVVLVVALAVGGYQMYHAIGDPAQKYEIVVKPNDSAADVERKLDAAGIDVNHRIYALLMRFTNTDKEIKPGRYEIKGGISHYELINIFKEGKRQLDHVTIPEGYSVAQIIPLLAEKLQADSSDLAQLINDKQFFVTFDIEAPGFEGYLFPETYSFYPYTDPKEIITEMVNMFKSEWTPEMKQQLTLSGMTLNQATTLASMIEAEATVDSEDGLISSVFHNRLRKGWKLQCDPTVIYAMGGLKRPLYRKDLEYESPFNTYLHEGLPPGPICSPGLKAIQAALWPEDSDYYFFVANGDGRHVFTKTLSQHNRAVAEIKREKRRERNK